MDRRQFFRGLISTIALPIGAFPAFSDKNHVDSNDVKIVHKTVGKCLNFAFFTKKSSDEDTFRFDIPTDSFGFCKASDVRDFLESDEYKLYYDNGLLRFKSHEDHASCVWWIEKRQFDCEFRRNHHAVDELIRIVSNGFTECDIDDWIENNDVKFYS